MILDWTDEILIGVPALDDDHRRIVSGINHLAALTVAGSSVLPDMIDGWIALFGEHARKEENLLARLALPGGRAHHADHAAGHRQVLARANQIRASLLAGEGCGGMMERLADVLMVTEIIRDDFDMVGHLRREGLLLPNGVLRAAE